MQKRQSQITNQADLLDFLSLISDALGVYNVVLNLKQVSTDKIMSELKKQDDVYFNQILETQKEIIARLDKIESQISSK